MKDNIKLNELPRHNIYQVPENYFERLPLRVMERTAAATAPETSQLTLLWQSVRMVIAPFVLLLVFLGVYYLNMPAAPEQHTIGIASLQDDEIVDYLSTYATLESNDFADMNTLEAQELTAEVLNVSATNAEEELEYYNIQQIDY